MLTIRRIGRRSPPAWLRQCALLHQQEIPDGFLSSLPVELLETLYGAIAASRAALLYGAFLDGELAGFIAGAERLGPVCANLFRRCLKPSLAALLLTVARRDAERLIESALSPSRGPAGLPKAQILNFCVDRRRQSQGVGRQLFQSLVREFAVRGRPAFRIVTGAQQQRAQRFYRRAGAELVGATEVHQGVPSLVFVYRIPEASQFRPGRAA